MLGLRFHFEISDGIDLSGVEISRVAKWLLSTWALSIRRLFIRLSFSNGAGVSLFLVLISFAILCHF